MNKINRNLVLCSFCMVTGFYCHAKNYYVKTNGIQGLPGSSWSWASPDLQATIDKAASGDVVYVAAGVYYGGFIMKEGVNVMGGYTANNSNPTERYELTDAESSHHSILDGEAKQRVITQILPFSTSTVWEGFSIQNGNPAVSFKKGSIIYSQNGDNKIIGILYKYQAETESGKMIGTNEIWKQWGGYENEIDELASLVDRNTAKTNITGQENSEKIFSELGQNSIDFSTADYSGNGNYAAYWCDTITTGGYNNWYLPAPGELQEVYDASIKNILETVGKNLKYPFWTSGQVGNTLAWAYCFGDGYCHPALKYVTCNVSAIHDFNAPAQPGGIYFAGGGVILKANGTLKNSIVTNNTSSSKGGGVYVGKDGQIVDCTVERNNAPEGKEIYYEMVSGIDATFSSSFNVYPNPSHAGDNITITNLEVGAYNYVINNASGQIISLGTLKNGKISVPAEKGIYILIIQSEKVKLSKKLIIK